MSQKFITNISVAYGTEPGDAVREIHGQSADINKGFGGEYVYIVPEYTSDPSSACNRFGLAIQDDADSSYADLAKGAGGQYRYMLAFSDLKNEDRITALGLLRSSSAVSTPPTGYTGMTSDINAGRHGDFLYLVWQSTTVASSALYSSGLSVLYGTMKSQEPRGSVTELTAQGDDTNQDFGGSYVWISNTYTSDPTQGYNYLVVVVQSTADPDKQDLAKGAGGDFRYLIKLGNNGDYNKVTLVRLLRSQDAIGTVPTGYTGMSGDINQGRGKSYLYAVWKTAQTQPPAARFVSGITVTFGTLPSQEPSTAVTELTGQGDDINKDFGGDFVWISTTFTSTAADACNALDIAIQDQADPSKTDLAHGAGGKFRYLLPLADPGNTDKITNLRLLRSSAAVDTPPAGYNGMTGDINGGRGGSYLYVVWQSQGVNAPGGQFVADMKVTYGDQPSQEPVNTITAINFNGNDINKSFGGSYVWLSNDYTTDPSKARTGLSIQITSEADPDKQDLAKGAGGDYRYLIQSYDPTRSTRIIETRLLRASQAVAAPPAGYDGMTTDINSGRGGDFLYIVWKTGVA